MCRVGHFQGHIPEVTLTKRLYRPRGQVRRLPDKMRAHELRADRPQDVIASIFHQRQLSSIEDHADLMVRGDTLLLKCQVSTHTHQ